MVVKTVNYIVYGFHWSGLTSLRQTLDVTGVHAMTNNETTINLKKPARDRLRLYKGFTRTYSDAVHDLLDEVGFDEEELRKIRRPGYRRSMDD
jgi:hypothetical protein